MAGADQAGRRCPICSRPTERDTRPFCSKRCADLDLHRWLGGQYAIPVVEEDGSAEPGASEIDGGETTRH